MRYMIAHMISGDAKAYLGNLGDVIAGNYRLRSVSLSIDPHLTVKAPFDALSTDFVEVEHIVERVARSASQHPYTLKGFGGFGDRVVYMDVDASSDIPDFIARLKEELKQVPWMEFKPHEEETKLHATLCYPKSREQADDIIGRLNARGGKEFSCTFDSIALLKKGERRWEVMKEFKIGGGDGLDVLP